MAKKIAGLIKLQVAAGAANPSPPVGPALGQHGVNIMEFCKAFNEKTKSLEKGLPIPTGFDGTPKNFEILATAPAALSEADDSVQMANKALYGDNAKTPTYEPGAAVMGLYNRGGTVFTTGCTDWTNGLRGHDKAVECITHNLLNRLSN